MDAQASRPSYGNNSLNAAVYYRPDGMGHVVNWYDEQAIPGLMPGDMQRGPRRRFVFRDYQVDRMGGTHEDIVQDVRTATSITVLCPKRPRGQKSGFAESYNKTGQYVLPIPPSFDW